VKKLHGNRLELPRATWSRPSFWIPSFLFLRLAAAAKKITTKTETMQIDKKNGKRLANAASTKKKK